MSYKNPVGTKVPNASPVRQGDRVRVRDAYGDWHEMDALSGPQWGRDFVVVWVARLAGDDPIPWPVEDVELPDAEEQNR